MKIGILGSGLMGGKLGTIWAQAGDLSGKILVNYCVPLDMQNRALVVGTTTSGAEELVRRMPGARLVCAFNTSPSECFFDVFEARHRAPRPQLLCYGDNQKAREVAQGLIRDVGFEPLDAGPLRTARFAEPFAMVTAEFAHNQPGGPKLVYRFDRPD